MVWVKLVSRYEDVCTLDRRLGEWCRVYWGTHGCDRESGHAGPHECDCCDCENHPDPDSGCVAKPPYYGADTKFYGEDA